MRTAKTLIRLGRSVCAEWSVFAVCYKDIATDLRRLQAESEDSWSDLADRSLRLAHRSFCWFCHTVAQLSYLLTMDSLDSDDNRSLLWTRSWKNCLLRFATQVWMLFHYHRNNVEGWPVVELEGCRRGEYTVLLLKTEILPALFASDPPFSTLSLSAP